MRHRHRGASLLAPTVAAFLGSGCLPTGDPPVGQHIVFDRTLTGAFFAPPGTDGGESALLASGPVLGYFSALGEIVFNLYQFPPLDSGPHAGIEGLTPALANVILSDGQSPADFRPQTDSAGRLICAKGHTSTEDDGSYVARVDLSIGEEVDLGWQGRHPAGFLLSPSRRRVFVNDRIFNADDTVSLIGPDLRGEPVFIGDDLYYGVRKLGTAGAVSSIYRDRINRAPESLLTTTAMVSFRAIPTDLGAQLFVSLQTEGGEIPFLLLDTEHQSSTQLPSQRGGAQLQSLSSDGHWMAFGELVPEGGRLFLFDWTWTASASLILNGSVDQAEWRPGYHELWIPLDGGVNAVWVANSDTVNRWFPATISKVDLSPDGRRSMFTRDGSHWFSTRSRPSGSDGIATAFFVANADDPSSPPVQLNPWGEELASLWEMADGRLLVGGSALRVSERQDIFLVDPDAGSSKLIASGGHVVALGQNRALALLNWQLSSSTGDLTLIDLATGAKTLLAESVYFLAVDAATSEAGKDTLAPGTRIAFLVRNRLASPYDGLWVARLP